MHSGAAVERHQSQVMDFSFFVIFVLAYCLLLKLQNAFSVCCSVPSKCTRNNFEVVDEGLLIIYVDEIESVSLDVICKIFGLDYYGFAYLSC